MSPETTQWITAVHVVGFLLWTGGLMSCMQFLRVHHAAGVDSREALQGTERRVALSMDIGATLAIAAGLILALGRTPSAFKEGGWLHLKLTLVVIGLLVLHGYVRVKIKKFRNGDVVALPGFLYPLTVAVIVAIVGVAVVKPFAAY